jgi:uncharacterized membrane protein YfcA
MADTVKMNPMRKMYQLIRLIFGKATSFAPIIRGNTKLPITAGTAGIIGLYDGFFGPGTGSFLVFLFVRGFGLDFLHASASAKIVNAATNAAAIILFGLTGELFWLLGLSMSVCNVVGAQFGSHLAIRRGSALVRKVFMVVVFSLIAKTAWDAIRMQL